MRTQHARPQGPTGFRVMDWGDEGTGRTSRPYLQARSCGRAGRGAGGALPGPRPASRGPAAHGPRLVQAPSGRELALAAAPPSVVHNLEGSCAPRWPGAAPARLSWRRSSARSELSPARCARPPVPAPTLRPCGARPPGPTPAASSAPSRRAGPAPAAPPALRGACSAPAAAARCLRWRRLGCRALGPRGVRNWPAAAPFGASVRGCPASRSGLRARRRGPPPPPPRAEASRGVRDGGPGSAAGGGRLGGLSKWSVWGVDAFRGRAPGGDPGPSGVGTMGVSRKPRCRNGGKSTSGSHKSGRRAPRPLPSALSVPEMA